MASRRAVSVVLALALALQPVASWAEPSAADKENARSYMDEGDRKMSAGDLREALRLYKAADSLMNVPTTGVEVGRVQVKLGLLVEARETFQRVMRIPIAPSEPAVFAKARSDAEQMSAALQERIPSVKVIVEGLSAGSVPEVTIDGEALVSTAIGLPRKINPGTRRIVASARGYESASTDITIAEKESRDVVFQLKRLALPEPAATVAPTSTASAPATASAPPTPPAPPAPPAVTAETKLRKPMLMYGGFGLGVLGLTVGGVGGLVALSKASSVKSKCDGERCPELVRSDIVSTKNWALVSNIGFGVGIVGAGIGLVALIAGTGGASSSAQGRRVEPFIGLGDVGVRGQF